MTGSPFDQALLEIKRPEGFAEFRAEELGPFYPNGPSRKKGAVRPISPSLNSTAQRLDTRPPRSKAAKKTPSSSSTESSNRSSRASASSKTSSFCRWKRRSAPTTESSPEDLHTALSEEKDPFALLNSLAAHPRRFCVYSTRRRDQHPIRSVHYLSRPCFPRVQLFVGAKARVEWISTVVQGSPQPLWSSLVFDAALDEGAEVHLTESYTLSSESFLFDATRASLKKQAQFTAVTVHKGSRALRQDYHLHLLGEEAAADLSGLALLQDNQQAHVHVRMEHEAPTADRANTSKGSSGTTASRASKERSTSTRKRRRPRPTS